MSVFGHEEAGDPTAVPGLRVTDLDDVEQIRAIPPAPGMSFRGRGPDDWEVGRVYREPGWLRSSRDPQVGSDNFAGGGVVVLFGRDGRDLVGFGGEPAEQETVFLPGAWFSVVRRGDLDGLWVDVVVVHRDGEHDAPEVDVDTQVQRAATVLARARTVPPVALARPGRFAGPFGVPS